MPTSTTPLGPDFAKDMIAMLFQAVEDGTKMAAHMLWDILMSVLKEHWLLIFGLVVLVLIVATIKAILGRWGSLGSVLYNLFYFGTLFIIGLVWGPEIFVDDIFNAACAVILYPVCFILVGIILDKIGVRK